MPDEVGRPVRLAVSVNDEEDRRFFRNARQIHRIVNRLLPDIELGIGKKLLQPEAQERIVANRQDSHWRRLVDWEKLPMLTQAIS